MHIHLQTHAYINLTTNERRHTTDANRYTYHFWCANVTRKRSFQGDCEIFFLALLMMTGAEEEPPAISAVLAAAGFAAAAVERRRRKTVQSRAALGPGAEVKILRSMALDMCVPWGRSGQKARSHGGSEVGLRNWKAVETWGQNSKKQTIRSAATVPCPGLNGSCCSFNVHIAQYRAVSSLLALPEAVHHALP